MSKEERHRRVESIFDHALELSDPAAREQYVRESCAFDGEVERELRQLLQSYDSWTAKLQLPQPSPIRCGPYECLELLGSGGMGSVYRARRADGQFEQEVAIKFLRGSLRTDAYRARFATERQILAQLNHPNIARLLDGGVTGDGEPYLVMELVNGEPLDSYCDRLALKVEARLALFEQVLEAVDAAHRNLVVHRDLKPSNILVNREGVVKLLDFGTSKLLAKDATMTRVPALTPAYASPEQLRGEPAATTADVFSLGVVLFRLLTGGHPFGEEKSSYADGLDRALRETDPTRPEALVDDHAAAARSSTAVQLRKRVKGDLAAILRKALAHHASARYPSVAALADDLRRHQEQRPVRARRHNWTYLTSRALRRHARSVIVAAVFVAGLTGAALFSARQAQLAQREAERAQAANRFLTEIFALPAKDTASRHDLTVRELLELAERRVTPLLGADPVVAADVDLVLGSGFFWQGATPKARQLYERALDNARKAGDVPRQALATARLGGIEYAESQFDPAWRQCSAALALWKEHRAQFAPVQSVAVLLEAATILLYTRPFDAAHREYFVEAVALCRKYSSQLPVTALPSALQKLAESYINVDRRYQEAYDLLSQSIAICRANPAEGVLLLENLQSFGRVNRFLGRHAEDEEAQREGYELRLRLNGPQSQEAIAQRALWAQALVGAGRLEEGYAHATAALSGMRRHMPARATPLLWTNLSAAFTAACLTKRFAECETLAREAIDTLGPKPAEKDLRFVDARGNLALGIAGQGRLGEARPIIEKTLAVNLSRQRRPAYTLALEAALK